MTPQIACQAALCAFTSRMVSGVSLLDQVIGRKLTHALSVTPETVVPHEVMASAVLSISTRPIGGFDIGDHLGLVLEGLLDPALAAGFVTLEQLFRPRGEAEQLEGVAGNAEPAHGVAGAAVPLPFMPV